MAELGTSVMAFYNLEACWAKVKENSPGNGNCVRFRMMLGLLMV
jgi:hypothetical protein